MGCSLEVIYYIDGKVIILKKDFIIIVGYYIGKFKDVF